MIEYLELPFAKCKNCSWFESSSSKKYDTCHNPEVCPAFEVQIVIRDSVTDLVTRYKKAIKSKDFESQVSILKKVQSNRGLEYKFKKELEK